MSPSARRIWTALKPSRSSRWRPRRVPQKAQIERQVEGNRDRRASVLAGSPDQLAPSHPFDVGGVNHRQDACRQSRIEPSVEPVEGGVGRVLVGLVAGERPAQLV